jgi:hypothetical protein
MKSFLIHISFLAFLIPASSIAQEDTTKAWVKIDGEFNPNHALGFFVRVTKAKEDKDSP